MTKSSFFFTLLVLHLATHSIIGQHSFDPKNIEIIRDQYGVPHIYAPTDPEVAYGLAWAHAEDDFQTIQQTLLAGKQMLGRYLGKEGAPIDYVVGLLDCEGVVNAHMDDLSSDFVKLLEGYVAGLNAFAAAYPDKVLVKKAFPVSVDEMMRAYVLSLSVMLGADRTIQQLFNNQITSLWGTGQGSNAFAFSRSRTIDGNVYLAINSHQPLEGPSSWYEAHLVSEDGWNAMGGLFPGGATIFHGTNPHLGWAHTVNYPDKVDTWQLQMSTEDDEIYLVDGEEVKLDTRKVKLKVKTKMGLTIGVTKKAYNSIYGPVVKNDSGVFAFDLAALHDLRVPEQWYRMNKATNFAEFKSALDMMALPMFNIVYADRYDEIFYVSNALLPKRNPKYDWEKVVPGNTRETLYDGYYAFDDLPQVHNPDAGYVYNTNHSPFLSTEETENPDSTAFAKAMGYKVWNNNRSLRLKQLIDEHSQLTWDDFLRIKYDVTLPDSLAFFLNLNELFKLNPSDYLQVEDLIQLLTDWDRSAKVNSIGTAQIIILYQHLLKELNLSFTEKYQPTTDELLDGLVFTRAYLLEHFGKLDVTLGEYQKLVRGDKALPVAGMPDVLAAMYSVPFKDGMVKGAQGESYIMLVRYPEEGLPIIETVNVYGASNQPESAHYDDQMELFVNQQRKPMTLDIQKVRESAERIYHPLRIEN